MIKTSRTKEVAFCAYNGLYFGKLKRDGSKFEIAISTTDCYLQDKSCTRGIEYGSDRMLICVNDDESFYLLDRTKKTPISKVKWNAPSLSFNYEVFAVPGFCIKKMPFLILRDDY
jgi:hypothetical protein